MEQFIAFIAGGVFFCAALVALNYKHGFLPVDKDNDIKK